MLDGIRHGIDAFVTALRGIAPSGFAAGTLLALAAALALLVHEFLARIIGRLARGASPYTKALLLAARPITRLTFIVVALALVLPTAPLNPDVAGVVARALELATVVLAGWAAIVALGLASDLYLHRFELETADLVIARKHITQVKVLHRAATTLVVVVTVGAALMTFDSVREFGLSLFASAGVASIVVGLAARPVLSNLFAGVQLAISQPIRIDDTVFVEGEFGTIEEIGSSYVLVRIWDQRRLVVPLTYFMEKPFQNWTRQGTPIVGTTNFYLDYTAPVEVIRAKAKEIAAATPLWDGRTLAVQVTDARVDAMEVRVFMSAQNASNCWELRVHMREKMIEFLQRDMPHVLPRHRYEAAITATPSLQPSNSEPTPRGKIGFRPE
jgi:small-conductance mechanosensitive channel